MVTFAGQGAAGPMLRQQEVRLAANAARAKNADINISEQVVVGEMEKWERDKNPAHLVRAIQALQAILDTATELTEVTAAAMSPSGEMSPTGRAGAPIARMTKSAEEMAREPDGVGRAIRVTRISLRQTIHAVKQAAVHAEEALERTAEEMEKSKAGSHGKPATLPSLGGRGESGYSDQSLMGLAQPYMVGRNHQGRY